MPDPSQTGRRERTPGRRLHDRLEGSEVSSGSKYYDLMNPADKAGWERLAREIDKEMEGLGLRLNDAERDREKAEKRERALREALERIGYREACSGAEAEELRMLARAALGWECAECKNTGVAEGDQSKPCPRCGGASGMSACVPRSGHALDAALAASPGDPEEQRTDDGLRRRSMSQVIADAREIERQMAQPDHGPGEPSERRTWNLFCPECEQTSVDTGDGSCETCGAETFSVVRAGESNG